MPPSDPSPSDSSGPSETGEWVVVRTRNLWLRRLAVAALLLAVAAGTVYWKRAALRNFSNDLLAVLARLLPWEGGDPALINNAVYLSLIPEQPVGEAAVEVMGRIVEDHPEKRGFQNTLTLARIMAGDADAALALYTEMSSEAGGVKRVAYRRITDPLTRVSSSQRCQACQEPFLALLTDRGTLGGKNTVE